MSGAAFIPFSHKQYLLLLFVLCWGLVSALHKVTTDITHTLLPSNANWLWRAVIFARSANLAFLFVKHVLDLVLCWTFTLTNPSPFPIIHLTINFCQTLPSGEYWGYGTVTIVFEDNFYHKGMSNQYFGWIKKPLIHLLHISVVACYVSFNSYSPSLLFSAEISLDSIWTYSSDLVSVVDIFLLV